MRELVMVVQDLYVAPELRGSATAVRNVPGIAEVARAGRRVELAAGWRELLLRRAARTDLEGVAPACIAAAGLDSPRADDVGSPRPQPGARWLARALHLRAGLHGVHLDQGGLLRLSEAEQAQLAADFKRTFAASACVLLPLPSGEFLLDTPHIAPLPTCEPARAAGSDLGELMPAGPAAAPLRRLLGEIEMWLHEHALNQTRRQRGALTVSALWPWGASGRIVSPASGSPAGLPLACGRDAWLEGLWRLQGSALRPAAQSLEALLSESAADGVLLVELAGELRGELDAVPDALRRVDERLVSPALAALHHGSLDRLNLIVNDVSVELRRANLRRFWRRARPGLSGFL